MVEEDGDELPELLKDDEDDEEDLGFKEGDCMFAAGLCNPSVEIQATSTISQHLAEAFKRDSELARPDPHPSSFSSKIPDYLCEFEDIFSKKSFDILLENKP